MRKIELLFASHSSVESVTVAALLPCGIFVVLLLLVTEEINSILSQLLCSRTTFFIVSAKCFLEICLFFVKVCKSQNCKPKLA